ncbi:28S ribosomal protein S17 mitochondrial [Fasciola hepatica]|uniref:28S ribosomal protein S17 mitochondrial n=1 Tax=Fasciola hepatica TaxID=6192 RepID=A0A2H1CLB9_FASHE|nr:28S ribosomal protein S17 mitochondrial [Fasciola hepatica]
MVRYWRHRGKEIFKRLEPHINKYFPYHKPEMDQVSPSSAMYSGARVKPPFDLALGQIIPFGQSLRSTHPNIVKVRIHKLCLNRFLLKYYYQAATYWAHDQDLTINVGDMVLVEKTPEPIAFHTVYKVKKVVYPIGRICDPVTGLMSSGPEYTVDQLTQLLQSNLSTICPKLPDSTNLPDKS